MVWTRGKNGREKTIGLPNAARHGHVRGERSRGRPRKRWMDNVREGLEERGMQLSTAYGKTKNREFGEV